jgi:hypothetical protein
LVAKAAIGVLRTSVQKDCTLQNSRRLTQSLTDHDPNSQSSFPVAGLGTRFLPATKAMPKEMLTVVDKPLIQYAVEEAAAAGITDMIFVTGAQQARD